jgi:hypothetical protein
MYRIWLAQHSGDDVLWTERTTSGDASRYSPDTDLDDACVAQTTSDIPLKQKHPPTSADFVFTWLLASIPVHHECCVNSSILYTLCYVIQQGISKRCRKTMALHYYSGACKHKPIASLAAEHSTRRMWGFVSHQRITCPVWKPNQDKTSCMMGWPAAASCRSTDPFIPTLYIESA